jgi:hypothetical protein
MTFNPQELSFIARYGQAATLPYYEMTPGERGIAKVFQIRNLLTYTQAGSNHFEWTGFGKSLVVKAAKELI